MPEARVHIRRSRRTDFTAVMNLLAGSGGAVPPPDRATLRRFRNLVADLGTDFYLALVDGTLAGLVHVTYARQLAILPRARLEQLVVAGPFRRRGVGAALFSFALDRARQRGCAIVSCTLPAGDEAARQFIEKAGLRTVGNSYELPLAG